MPDRLKTPRWHLAEINLARVKAPLTDPMMAGFVAQLDAINRLADESPGFVWRLKAEDGAASSYIPLDGDARLIVNMSVWTSLEALHVYVYKSAHGAVFRNRRQWLEPAGRAAVALWWVAAGQVPALADGMGRLEWLERAGPSATAFTFKRPFPPPP